MRITRELLRQWGSCYINEKIVEIVPEVGLTPLEVCDCSGVPAGDRLWVLLREDVIPARELRLLACKWAREALAVVVSEQDARGDAASAAALAAAYTAARDTAAACDAHLADVRAVLAQEVKL